MEGGEGENRDKKTDSERERERENVKFFVLPAPQVYMALVCMPH